MSMESSSLNQGHRTGVSTVNHSSGPLVPIISPSILACDFARLAEECRDILSSSGGACEWIHVDVMDGHFVPNISIGPCVVQALRKHFPTEFLDVHCMITEPEKWVEEMAKAGASQMTFHIEAADNPKATAMRIQKAGMKVGVAIKPKTQIDAALKDLLNEKLVDMVLVMTVEPGFGGQSFMADMMLKVKALRELYPCLNIQVDGGLSDETIEEAAAAGANVIVAGTYIFKAEDRKAAIDRLRDTVSKYLRP